MSENHEVRQPILKAPFAEPAGQWDNPGRESAEEGADNRPADPFYCQAVITGNLKETHA